MLRILIVDDFRDDATLAGRALRRANVLNPIHLLKTGEECIKYFTDHCSDSLNHSGPCLVFLDMAMQPVDGLTVLRVLNSHGVTNDSVFVMLSGVSDLKIIQEGYRLGARTFLRKPFEPHGVAHVLISFSTKISIEKGPDGNVLHWVFTPLSQQSSDTNLIRKAANSEGGAVDERTGRPTLPLRQYPGELWVE